MGHRINIFILGLFLAGCSGGDDSNKPKPKPPPLSGWTQFYGSGVTITDGRFDFPRSPGSVHYIVEAPPPLALGQTITLTFAITGAGTWGISGTDTPPPTIHLLLWEQNDPGTGQGIYETYREWSGRVEITNPDTYTISAKIDPSQWTGVFGQTPSAPAFQNLLTNLFAVGFTFGGASFAGHGVYSATGLFHFTLISYTIQ